MRRNWILIGSLPLALVACEEMASSPLAPETMHRDLSIGDSGDDVRVLHAYLMRYGYFPNSELQRQYPAWRPIVPEAPAAADVFDEHTAEAVRALQANMGLARTGVVEEPTRGILRMPRCGVPEGMTQFDPSDKFSLFDATWTPQIGTPRVLHWKVIVDANHPLPSGFTLAQTQNLAAAAFQTWRNEITNEAGEGLQFVVTTGATEIDLQFGSISASDFGITNGGAGSHVTITLNINRGWNNGIMQGIFTHEIGHGLGLNHGN